MRFFRFGILSGFLSLLAFGAVAVAQEGGPTFADVEAAWNQLVEERQAVASGMAANLDAVSQNADLLREDLAAEGFGKPPELPADILDGTGLEDSYRALMDGERHRDGRVYVLVSLSMPQAALKQLVDDAHRSMAVPVMRGFDPGKYGEFSKRLQEAGLAEGGVIIDPNVFKAFGVEAVPTFIASSQGVVPCRDLGCTPVAPTHDKLSGNITMQAALEILAKEGRDAPGVANQALRQLGWSRDLERRGERKATGPPPDDEP